MGCSMGCGKSKASEDSGKASNADFEKTLAKDSGETAEKQNPQSSIELLQEYAGKCDAATVDEIAAALSDLSVAGRQKLAEALGSSSNVLEDARADVEAQPPQGATNGDDKVEEASKDGTGQQDNAEVTALEVPSGGICAGCC